MSITKNLAGAWVVFDLVGNYLVRRTYYGHTKREAVRLFREEMKSKQKPK